MFVGPSDAENKDESEEIDIKAVEEKYTLEGKKENVVIIDDMEHWKQFNEENKIVVVKFTTEKCKPCKQIAPLYKEMSARFSSVAGFCEIDVFNPDFNELETKYNVNVLPTFIILKNAELHGTLAGITELDSFIMKSVAKLAEQ